MAGCPLLVEHINWFVHSRNLMTMSIKIVEDIGTGLLGVCLTYTGYKLLDNPIWCSYFRDYCADFTGVNFPFGVFLILLGLFSILYCIFGRRYDGDDLLMCIQCNEPHERKNTQNHKCPVCSRELEPLKGFYDRHPELKEKS